jgi:glycerate dehydrogenase
MRIVVVDGHTLNPGDLSWQELEQLGELRVFPRSSPDELLARAREAEAALTNKAPFDRKTIEALPKLKYIGVTATGYNIVDVTAARERGVTVTNVPAYGSASVAQMAFALLLELTNRVGHHAATVRERRWSQSPDFCYWDYPLIELSGKTLGIVGLGKIGEATARIGLAFGMNVIATQRTPKARPSLSVEFVSMDELFSRSDVVSLHCPLTAETKGLVNKARLQTMKPSAFLINTSRGPLIVEEHLAEALAQKTIAGAGLDVLAVEPPPPNHILFHAPNCLITPHISWATYAARKRLMDIAVANLKGWSDGAPQNVVS